MTPQRYFWRISISEALANGTYPSGAEESGRGAIGIDGMNPYKRAPVAKIYVSVSVHDFQSDHLTECLSQKTCLQLNCSGRERPGNTITAGGSHSSLQQETSRGGDEDLDCLAADLIVPVANSHSTDLWSNVKQCTIK